MKLLSRLMVLSCGISNSNEHFFPGGVARGRGNFHEIAWMNPMHREKAHRFYSRLRKEVRISALLSTDLPNVVTRIGFTDGIHGSKAAAMDKSRIGVAPDPVSDVMYLLLMFLLELLLADRRDRRSTSACHATNLRTR